MCFENLFQFLKKTIVQLLKPVDPVIWFFVGDGEKRWEKPNTICSASGMDGSSLRCSNQFHMNHFTE